MIRQKPKKIMRRGRSKSLASAIKDTLRSILLLTSLIFILGACSSEISSKKSPKDLTNDPSTGNPVTDPPSPPLKTTRIICFNLNEDRSGIVGYYGIDDNGEPCPKDVVIPTGISSIGSAAFENKALTSVVFPQSLTTIENNAFKNNSLTSLTIPESITSIGASAFQDNSLTSMIIPEGMLSIESAVFSNNSLTSVNIPESVTSIGELAFSGNSELKVAHVPNFSPTIASNAFPNGYVYGESTPINCFEFDTKNGISIVDYYDNKDDNISNPACPRDVVIPQGVTSIGDSAFQDSSLTSITIAESVTNIGVNAFSGNSFSSYIYIPNENAQVNANAFDTNVPVALEGTDSCFVRDQNDNTLITDYPCFNTTIEIPNDVVSIGNSAFKDKGLTSVSIPISVINIEANAFSGNSFSSYVYIPNENAQVNANAFDTNVPVVLEGTESCFARDVNDNTLVTDYLCFDTVVEIPSNVGSIGNNAFKDKGLTSVSIPISVINIEANAFSGNSFLSYVYIPNENVQVNANAFDINVPVVLEGTDDCFVRDENDNTLITDYLCFDTKIEIPNDVVSIGNSAFKDKGLTSVSIPIGVINIEANAFFWKFFFVLCVYSQ